MDSKVDIPLHGPSVQTVKKHAAVLSNVLLSRFMCEAVIDGVDLDGDSSTLKQKRASVTQEKKYECMLPSGVKVSVWKADLTQLQVEAVVNAANERLGHYGGLAYALCEAGGPQFQRESESYIERNGLLQTGDAIVTNAGKLPCKSIIHAVGPQVNSSMDLRQAEPLLERAIKNILLRVEEHHLQTVAIPAISSGLFNYPLKACAETIVSTVRRFYEHHRFHKFLPKEILLANHDDPSVDAMERACRQILGPSSGMSYSKAASTKTRGAATPPPITVQLGNVSVILKRGYIEEEQTDVIVNTASADRNLNIGQIAKALLSKAGPEMQKELYSFSQISPVLITKSYGLKCKEVYHTFCIEKRQYGAEKLLFDSVKRCLMYAAAALHKTIAFPAIGTGALRFHHREVAQIMSDALADFALKCPKKFEVHFVIFPSDHVVFQAFEEKIKDLPSKVTEFPKGLVETTDSHRSRAVVPQITLQAPSREALREAEKWLHNVVFKTPVMIYNNFIQHFGEEEFQQLSRLNRGGVSLEEFFPNGHACIQIQGRPCEDVAGAALQVEAMLCKVLQTFVREEESEMTLMTATNEVSGERLPVDRPSQEFKLVANAFRSGELKIIKVEKVVNPTLQTMFGLKKNHLGCSTVRTMYQRIPAQFCEMVSRIGFHAQVAPPEDPKFGQGIYFASSVENAMKMWKDRTEHYLYLVEAEVLTGESTAGKPDLILPPAVGKDPRVLYDSVNGGREVSLIFSGCQALPKYIITCERSS